jgi:hypothetical protein
MLHIDDTEMVEIFRHMRLVGKNPVINEQCCLSNCHLDICHENNLNKSFKMFSDLCTYFQHSVLNNAGLNACAVANSYRHLGMGFNPFRAHVYI